MILWRTVESGFRYLAKHLVDRLRVLPEIQSGSGDCILLRCACMSPHDDKNDFHSRVDSKFDEANITNSIAGTSDMIVDGDGYRPTSGCTL
jgi:hypothetical protein